MTADKFLQMQQDAPKTHQETMNADKGNFMGNPYDMYDNNAQKDYLTKPDFVKMAAGGESMGSSQFEVNERTAGS